MKFFVNKSGDFETDTGICLGDYLELFFYDVVQFDAGQVVTGNFGVRILHSLIHNDERQEDGQMVVHTWASLKTYLDTLDTKKINCLSVHPGGIVKVNHRKVKS